MGNDRFKPWERRRSGGRFHDDDSRSHFTRQWKRQVPEGARSDFGGETGTYGRRRHSDRPPFERPWEKKSKFSAEREENGACFSKFADKRSGRGGTGRYGRYRTAEDRQYGTKSAAEQQTSFKTFDGKSGHQFRKPWESKTGSTLQDGNDSQREKETKNEQNPRVPEGEILFGRQPVLEMLRAGRRIVKQIIVADSVRESDAVNEIIKTAESAGIKIIRHRSSVLDAWLNSANHQGVAAVCKEFPYCAIEEIEDIAEQAEGNMIFVILDHIVDPQNLGSLLRSCEAGGVGAVVIPADRAVGVTPAAVRASAGAAEHLKIACVPNIVQVMEKLKKYGFWTTGLEAAPEARHYTDVDFKGKVCLVVGSEGHGLSRLVREHCDFLAKIPLFGHVNSLNAGVAGAIAIYEALRQQHPDA